MNARKGNGHTPVVNLDRLPPHSGDAESAVLGCILLNPEEAIPVCVTRLGDKPEVFYDLKNREIYATLVRMFDVHQAIDLITLSDMLMFQGQLDEVGGTSYLANLPDATPSAANLSYYLDILLDHYRQRQLIQICTTGVGDMYEGGTDVSVLIDRTSQQLFDLASDQVVEEEEPMTALIHQAISDIELMADSHGAISGVASGFPDLDKLTTGFHGGELIIIAGRPSSGKSSISMNIAEHVAVEHHLPVGVFSLEMTRRSLVLRTLCSMARVNMRSVRDGFLAERDFPKLTNAAGRLNHAPLFINDRSGLSIMGLRTRARRMHRAHGIKLLIVDYLQLLSAERNRNDNRQEEVSVISRGLKALAKELDIPVIALSQLNRKIEDEKNRRPRLADLRESGAIENDADVVCLLYRPKESGVEEDDHSDTCAVNLYIAKQRNGPTADVPLIFLKGLTRFESAAKVSAEDTPPSEAQPSLPV